ncbi:hypothetical protein M1717_19005, partial [Salmonella enterica subsp. enterica serovar Pomona]|uniref:hypothetical protein n=1 Tax=Salmonella enterica TaxID=28901 RepID=UPI0021B1C5F6
EAPHQSLIHLRALLSIRWDAFISFSGVTVNVAFDYKRVAIPERLPAKQAALGFFLENTRFFSARLSQYLKLPDK